MTLCLTVKTYYKEFSLLAVILGDCLFHVAVQFAVLPRLLLSYLIKIEAVTEVSAAFAETDMMNTS